MAEESHSVDKHVKAYIAVFLALAVFTIVTVAVAQIDIRTPWNYVIALLIAAFKASLVAAIFMHLKWEKGGAIWGVLVLCAVFFIALMFLPVLTVNDLPPQVLHGTWG